eukprot:gnl/MRDRNA2_/MRDRNA2_92030_c0_seq1.p1 gnl/MRDRNA2_/MRDRNA2_92030_c0~~gnl/MRDRNA2_/MRDRNA2_92030_c0_seq1.p1  ORF type:complete len:303 (-),score=31.33 gnl/MRDRNA2_/MRDRNA2_92030_c0_seq1:15-827(-)
MKSADIQGPIFAKWGKPVSVAFLALIVGCCLSWAARHNTNQEVLQKDKDTDSGTRSNSNDESASFSTKRSDLSDESRERASFSRMRSNSSDSDYSGDIKVCSVKRGCYITGFGAKVTGSCLCSTCSKKTMCDQATSLSNYCKFRDCESEKFQNKAMSIENAMYLRPPPRWKPGSAKFPDYFKNWELAVEPGKCGCMNAEEYFDIEREKTAIQGKLNKWHDVVGRKDWALLRNPGLHERENPGDWDTREAVDVTKRKRADLAFKFFNWYKR